MYAINKFFHYITIYPITVHIDYTIIKNLLTKPITNGIVTRWLLLLQEFDISVMDRLGKNNLVADFISRIISTNKSL